MDKKEYPKIIGYLYDPGPWWLLVFGVAFGIFLTFGVCNTLYWHSEPASVALYSLTGLTGLYFIYLCVLYCLRVYRNYVFPWLYNNKLTRPFVTNYTLQSAFFTVTSTLVNLCFAIFNVIMAALYQSIWFGGFAGYYFVLIATRVTIVLSYYWSAKKHWFDKKAMEMAKHKIALAVGGFLLLVEVAMAFLIGHMVFDTPPIIQSPFFAIVNAAYAIYKLIVAIVNMVLSRKDGDPIVKSMKDVCLSDACLTMVSLTVTMIGTFAGGDPMADMKMLVGFTACVVVMILSALSIIREIREVWIRRKSAS